MLILAALQTGGASTGGTDAFEALFRELYEPVLGLFANRGCSQQECQDLAQETFLRAYQSFAGFRGDAKPSTWLFTIAINVWRNRVRDAVAAKRAGDEVALDDDLSDPASAERPLDEAMARERRRLLKTAIAKLPPKMRRCVWLRVYQDWSYREIAEILGVTVETAKSQVSLARPRLRSSLAEHYPELDDDPDDRGG
jgi:RNA polymerase sigma-70 factor (ECF subfamily)